MEAVTKKPIRKILASMALYETECYPIEDVQTVRATIQLLQYRKGWKYQTRKTGETVKVTRIA